MTREIKEILEIDGAGRVIIGESKIMFITSFRDQSSNEHRMHE